VHKVYNKSSFFIMWLLYALLLGVRQGRRSSGRTGGSERVEGNGNL